ncbi:substrate-binding periplasmic protein [Chitinimonas sp.]|uniref:substrate-binding periplasmic protein n=1 Tax=Chitinimonas sp. TaxID=1934313 RepID=UPI0035B35967
MLLSCIAVAAELSLRVEGQESVPPKFIFSAQGSSGICPDVLRAMERIDPGLRFVGGDKPFSLKLIEQGLEAGSVDVACALLDSDRRRAIARRLDTPVYRVKERLAARAGDIGEVASLSALAAAHDLVATYKGASYVALLRSHGVEVDDSSSDGLTSLRKVIAGRARYFYMNDLTLAQLVRDNGLQHEVRILKTVLHEEPIYFWVSQRLANDVAQRLNDDLQRLERSGELARIYAKYSE